MSELLVLQECLSLDIDIGHQLAVIHDFIPTEHVESTIFLQLDGESIDFLGIDDGPVFLLPLQDVLVRAATLGISLGGLLGGGVVVRFLRHRDRLVSCGSTLDLATASTMWHKFARFRNRRSTV